MGIAGSNKYYIPLLILSVLILSILCCLAVPRLKVRDTDFVVRRPLSAWAEREGPLDTLGPWPGDLLCDHCGETHLHPRRALWRGNSFYECREIIVETASFSSFEGTSFYGPDMLPASELHHSSCKKSSCTINTPSCTTTNFARIIHHSLLPTMVSPCNCSCGGWVAEFARGGSHPNSWTRNSWITVWTSPRFFSVINMSHHCWLLVFPYYDWIE